jgi:acyl-CoA synthetase (AMP-forming)/AMP-acid ligase II
MNVAQRLSEMAAARPDQPAVAAAVGRGRAGEWQWSTLTFAELDRHSDRMAAALRRLGALPGSRLALFVPAGPAFVVCVFGLLKAGVMAVLIDPGMGRRNLLGCLAEARIDGLIGVPATHAIRRLLRRRWPSSRFHVTVGRRWFWGGPTYQQIVSEPWPGPQAQDLPPEAPAAMIFTSGSTGPPKGVLYQQATFLHQVQALQVFGMQPGEVDLACFPLFGLFNAALGLTTVFPPMDFARPGTADPAEVVAAVEHWQCSQAFASPAVWERVTGYCLPRGLVLGSLRRVASAGAPVSPRLLEMLSKCLPPQAEIHTPYGATEALPVADITAGEVLGDTAAAHRAGRGICVGRRFPEVAWKVIRQTPEGIPTLDQAEELGTGEIGELIVSGPMVTRAYLTGESHNALSKIHHAGEVWHRMGDVGYLDAQDRFWYCGRMTHRVDTAFGPLYTECCEAIVNEHPSIRRSALVGVGPRGEQVPVIVAEPWPAAFPRGQAATATLVQELCSLLAANETTRRIDTVLLHPSLPVDTRHNAKIFREQVALWAARRLRR